MNMTESNRSQLGSPASLVNGMTGALIAVAAAGLLAGCAAAQYQPAGGQPKVAQGKGALLRVLDGMEVWDADGPPRRYEVVGRIDDERTGGALPRPPSDANVVKLAREAGGYALIEQRRESRHTGFKVLGTGAATENQGPALGQAPAVPLTRQAVTYLVIRYLD
jgi:hypothetical protein